MSQAYPYPHKHFLTLEGQHPFYLQQILDQAQSLLEQIEPQVPLGSVPIYYFGSHRNSDWFEILRDFIHPDEEETWDLSITEDLPTNSVLCQHLSNNKPGLLFWEAEPTGLAQQIAERQPHRLIAIKDGQYQAPAQSLALILESVSKLGALSGRSVVIGTELLYSSVGKSCANLCHLLGAGVYWPNDPDFNTVGLDLMGYSGPWPNHQTPDLVIGQRINEISATFSIKTTAKAQDWTYVRAAVQALINTFEMPV